MNKLIKTKGFTIVELLFVMTLSVVLIGATITITNTFATSAKIGRNEAVAQREIRVALDTVSNITKQASAIFIMPGDTFDEALSENWSYIGVKVKDGKSKIMHYIYDEGEKKHIERILCDYFEGVTYKFFLSKNNDKDEKLLEYTIVTYRDGNEVSRVNSKIEALNSLQLIDKIESNAIEAGQVLAYRDSARKLSSDIVANIVLVVDSSASMGGSMVTNSPYGQRRIEVLYEAATILLNKLGEADSINLAVVSFGDHAINGMRNPKSMDRTVSLKKFYPLAENIDKFRLLFDVKYFEPYKPEYLSDIWTQIFPSGATNLADGLRVGHVLLEDQSKKVKAETNKKVVDYLVLLVDGDSNRTYVVEGPIIRNELYLGRELDLQNSSNRFVWLGAPYNMTYQDAAKIFANRFVKSGIKSYLVGILDESEFASMNYLIGPDALNVEEAYQSQDAGQLKEIFTEIGSRIVDEMWFIVGPGYDE